MFPLVRGASLWEDDVMGRVEDIISALTGKGLTGKVFISSGKRVILRSCCRKMIGLGCSLRRETPVKYRGSIRGGLQGSNFMLC